MVNENYCMQAVLNQVVSAVRESQDTYAEYKEYRDISLMIQGTFPIHPELVTGNRVEDIFSLTDDDVYNSLMKEMDEPIKISMEAKKCMNTKEISFDIVIEELSDPDNPIPCNQPRNKRKNVRRWVENNLGKLGGVTDSVEGYAAQAIETLIPILEKNARQYYAMECINTVYSKIVNGVKEKLYPGGSYKHNIFSLGNKNDEYVCIKNATAFRNLLTELDIEYRYLDILKIFKVRGLIKTNGGRDYSFQVKGAGWWYYIYCDNDLLKKVEENDNEC